MEDELSAAVLRGGDPCPIFEAGAPERGELSLLPLFCVFVRRIVLVEGALVLDKRCRDPLLR